MVLWDLGSNWWLGTTYNWCTQSLVAIIVLLYILRSSTKLKYYFSYGFYISLTLTLSIFYIPLFMIRPWNPANIRLIKPSASIISKIIGIKWELRGKEMLSVDRAGVLIGNHQSLLDALGIAEITPYLKKCVTISRKEIFYYWPFGLSAWLAGVVFIDRYNGRTANKILLDTCSVILNHKAKLLIFPEGTRNRVGDKLLPFKKGAFRVAIAAQIPLLPIVFSPYYFIDSQRKCFDGGRMIIQALDPIPTEGLTTDDIDALMEKTWNVMMDHYQMLKKEIHHEIKTKIVDQF